MSTPQSEATCPAINATVFIHVAVVAGVSCLQESAAVTPTQGDLCASHSANPFIHSGHKQVGL